MIDDVIYNMLQYVADRRTEAGQTTDLPALTRRLGYQYREADLSFFDAETATVHVKRSEWEDEMRSDAAHEIVHALVLEGDPSYDEVIRHRHAHAPNVVAHLERLIDHGGDLFQMPDYLVELVLGACDTKAEAVWVLHQLAKAPLPEALRRMIHFNFDARMGGFIAVNGIIRHAYSYRWHMPCWVGQPMPDPDYELQGPGVSLFQVPARRNTVIGLIVIEE